MGHLYDVPKQLKASLLFDQSVFVKEAINTVMHEGLIGLVLTGIMILLFLGNVRATGAVLLSIPLSALATVVILKLMGATINTMILAGIALAFSRVIDNSVISLENIYRHLEMGSAAAIAAKSAGRSRSRGAGGHAGRRGRFLSRNVPLWRQQVSVHGARPGFLYLAADVVRGRHDRNPAVLLALSDRGPA
jgi:uncharacterized membrane protein YecN with MAPEG domain